MIFFKKKNNLFHFITCAQQSIDTKYVRLSGIIEIRVDSQDEAYELAVADVPVFSVESKMGTTLFITFDEKDIDEFFEMANEQKATGFRKTQTHTLRNVDMDQMEQ